MADGSDANRVVAFWGCSFADQKVFRDGVAWLRLALSRAMDSNHNVSLSMFEDVNEVGPGFGWRQRVESTSVGPQINLASQVYIPLVTPNFFRDGLCRQEAKDFLNLAKIAGSSNLILPVYLTTTDILEQNMLRENDHLAQAFHGSIFDDWREFADELLGGGERSELVGKVEKLAAAIVDRLSVNKLFTPPSIPEQGTGPHFRINEDGLIDCAPDDAYESDENETRMASLQAGLKAGCDRLLGSGISQNAFGYLIDDIKAYLDAILPPVSKIQFTDVWRLGVVLQDHADAVSRNVDRLGPSLEDDQQAALKSLVGLHGPFILSSEEGRALQALANENRSTRDELKQFEDAVKDFAQVVKDSEELVTDRAKDLIAEANQDISWGRYPERHAITAQTTNQNFLSVVCTAAAFTGCAAAGAVIGEAATRFLVGHEMVLKGLVAASGEGLAWLPHLITWVKG